MVAHYKLDCLISVVLQPTINVNIWLGCALDGLRFNLNGEQ